MGDRAEVELGFEDREIQQGLARAEKRFESFGRHISKQGEMAGEGWKKLQEASGLEDILKKAIGGGTIIGAVEMMHSLTEEYAKLYDTARRLDTSGESVQRLNRMAQLGGTDMEGLVRAVEKLCRNLENVDDPKVQKAMDELRLSAVDLAGIGPEKQIEMIAHAFQRAQSEGRGFNSVFELMGKSSGELLALFRDFDEIKHKANFSGVISDEDLKRAKEASDVFGDLWAGMKQIGTGMVIDIAKDLTHSGKNTKSDQINRKVTEQLKKDIAEKEAAEKEKAEKAAVAARIEEAGRAKTSKAIMEDLEKERSLRDSLEQDRTAALEAAMTDSEKLCFKQGEIRDLDSEILQLEKEGPPHAGDMLRLQIQREKVERELLELEKRTTEESARQTKELRDQQLALAKRLEHEQKAEQKKAEAKTDIQAELQVLALRAAGREQAAQGLEREIRIEQEKRRIMAAGIEDEYKAFAMAKAKVELEEKIQRKKNGGFSPVIKGYKDPRDHTSTFRGLDSMKPGGTLRSEWQFHGLDALDALHKKTERPGVVTRPPKQEEHPRNVVLQKDGGIVSKLQEVVDAIRDISAY